MVKDTLQFKKNESWKMFDEISPRYDLLNHLLSFGLDIRWRKTLTKFLPLKDDLKILDLATGTADVLLSMFKHNKRARVGVGIDLADKMLEIGRSKIAKAKQLPAIHLQHGDATAIPFENNTFDTCSIAFGIRNVEDPNDVLKEMYRVLKPNGRALILEFSLPKNQILRGLHLFYLRIMVPLIGGLLTGHYKAYRYLNQTIEAFPYGENFCRLLSDSGFKNVAANPLLFGVATIYQGDK